MNKATSLKATSLTDERSVLFNKSKFEILLSDSTNPIVAFKESINSARQILDQRFRTKSNIETIIHDLSWFIDQILKVAWQQYDWKDAQDISLLAVGGYGREELHPYSDIDIQILLKKDNKKKYKENIEKFLTFLWDINLEVGQSVRSIKENKIEAKKDITTATALMESRTIYGNPDLHQEVMSLMNKKNIWDPKKFFAAKVAEQESRHSKYDDIEYTLEPNLKVSPGGLRDIQNIGWIAKRYFGASDFQGLVDRGFLQKGEYKDLINGRNFLWSLRYGLHIITGRREDRLLFEYQRKLAEFFFYKDDEKSLAIEKLMQKYYRIVLTLRELNDVLLQLFDEDILRSKEKEKIKIINSRFQIRNNYIEATNSKIFQQTPSALIEIFVLFAQDRKIEGIRASTIRLIRNSRKLIDEKFRESPTNKALFMELLRSPHKMVSRLRQMKRYGILSAYLPEFGKIVGQMQHDLFHIYTVDDHTLQVMENIRRFSHPEAHDKFPIAAQIVNELPKLELLYISALYHDIAKGRGGDHSILGVEDAERFCEQHGLSDSETKLIGWLVKNHLKMSNVAQRKDIQDPEIIKAFSLIVEDQVYLDHLYVLTVADINATNPKLWNTWRASLLRQLYLSTKRVLSQGLENTAGKSEKIKSNQNKAIALLEQRGLSKSAVLTLWSNPADEYFLRESAEDIVWQTQALSQHQDKTMPLILVKNSTEHRYEGATQIFIYCKNSNFLFANITAAFDQLNINIQDARFFQSDNEFCFSTFMVLAADSTAIMENPELIKEMTAILHKNSLTQFAMTQKQPSANSRQLKYFNQGTEIKLSNRDNMPYSILEVICPDRRGLLAKISNVFLDMDLILHNVKITTLGENVDDVFFISDNNNQALLDEKVSEDLQQAIKEILDTELDKE